MGGNAAFALGVAVLVIGVLASVCMAVQFVRASRRFARRPWLPYDDRPPAGLRTLRSAEISREVEAGLATMIGYLRRRTLQG